jgi:hypothetical protein
MSIAPNQSPVERLKSIFAPAGVNSRSELASRINDLESELAESGAQIPEQVKAREGAPIAECLRAEMDYYSALVSARGSKSAGTAASAPAVAVAAPAPAVTGIPADVATARALLDKYEAMQGRARSRFFADNSKDLFAAAAVVEKFAADSDAAPVGKPADAAAKLLATYEGLSGRDRAAFLREHRDELQSAAALVAEDPSAIRMAL